MGSQATRNSAHSGRQRRPHKGLYGFCNPVTKPQFRGCSNFNLADLGVANFTANLAGYSAMYVVLCCTAKGSGTMAKRRPSGDGMVRKREDGRWEGRIVVGHKKNGDPIHRYVLARTQGVNRKAPRLHRDVPRRRPHRGFEYDARGMARPMD